MPAERRGPFACWTAAQTGLGLWVGLLATNAQAHSTIKGVGDFWAGFFHPLTGLEDILPFLALGILCGQRRSPTQTAPAVFSIALMVGAISAFWLPVLPTVDLINILSALILGALVATALPLPVPAYLALALVFGLSHGYANGTAIEPPINPYLFIPGVGLAGMVTTGYGVMITNRVLRRKIGWMTIAVRVAGSWIAATGVLVLATSWKRLQG